MFLLKGLTTEQKSNPEPAGPLRKENKFSSVWDTMKKKDTENVD